MANLLLLLLLGVPNLHRLLYVDLYIGMYLLIEYLVSRFSSSLAVLSLVSTDRHQRSTGIPVPELVLKSV